MPLEVQKKTRARVVFFGTTGTMPEWHICATHVVTDLALEVQVMVHTLPTSRGMACTTANAYNQAGKYLRDDAMHSHVVWHSLLHQGPHCTM